MSCRKHSWYIRSTLYHRIWNTISTIKRHQRHTLYSLSILRRHAAAGGRRGGRGGRSLRSSGHRGGSDQSRGHLRGRAGLRGCGTRRTATGASDPARSNSNVIVPERVGRAAVRLPAEVHARDLGHELAPSPTIGVGVGDAWADGEASDGGAVEPGLDGAVGAQVVLETLPCACWKVLRGRDALW